LKVLYVLNEFRDGGAELGLVDLVQSGFFDGHELVICALATGRSKVHDRLLALVGPRHVRCLTKAASLRDVALPFAVARLALMFRSECPDLVILSLPQANLAGRIASAFVPHALVVSFEHSIEYRRKVAHFLMAATAPLVDAVFYDHPETWRNVRALFPRLREGAAHYVPLTLVDPVKTPPPIPSGRRHCVTTMRLEPVKNHLELFQAIRILLDQGYDLDLTVAGEGPMRGALESQISNLCLGDRVRMLGFVDNPWDHLRTCDTYILSSSQEGLSRSVIEAMAAGLVVVSTDVGGIRHYGVHGQNMIKARGTSAVELATALASAIDLGKNARRLQEAALRTAESEFSRRVVRNHWQAALRAVEERMQARVPAVS
jgi:hypothetical protein